MMSLTKDFDPAAPDVVRQEQRARETPAMVAVASGREQSLHAMFLCLSLCVLSLSALLTTRGEQQVLLPLVKVPLPGLCTAKRCFGIECPGCGLTRSFISIAHGDLPRAWYFNPAGILLFALVIAQIPYRAIQLWRIRSGAGAIHLGHQKWIVWPLMAALLGQWLIRTIDRLL
jgi:hypothetical protein